jgi:hypothetical protein
VSDSGPHPTVKQRVFRAKLNPSSGRVELSTFCIDNLSDSEAVELIEGATRRQHAHAVIKTESIVEIGLQIDPDWQPERHVNIVGWADDPNAEHVIMATAQRIVHAVDRIHFWS